MRLTAAFLALLIAVAALVQGCGGGESATATDSLDRPPKAPHSDRIEAPPGVPQSI